MEEGGSEGVSSCPKLYLMVYSVAFREFRYRGGGWLDVVCGRSIGVVCFGDKGVPLGGPCFPEWGEVFEDFVGVVDGLALLYD